MRVELMGQVRVVDQGRILPVHGVHAHVVLAVLAVERGRTVTHDELAEALWPGRMPRSWESMLRTAVSRVRAVFGDRNANGSCGSVLTRNGTYRLELPRGSSVDINDAATDLDAAVAATLAEDWAAARDLSSAARQVLAQPFLPVCSSGWIETQRERLSNRLVEALEVLSTAHARLGASTAAVSAAREAVALQPLRESAHRTLIAAHVAGGNRGEGARAYEVCQQLLMDELGVRPAPETEALYRSLVGLTASAPPTRVLPPPFPAALMREGPFGFVNRRRERATLLRAGDIAAAGGSQLTLVAGEAGIGKTQLIAESARALAARGAVVLYARCIEAVPLNQPIVDCLRGWASGQPDAAIEDVLGPCIDELTWKAPELATRLRHRSAPHGGASTVANARPSDAVLRWLQSLASSYPVVLVVEDLQWASEQTFSILRHVLAAAPPALMVIGSYRSTETIAGHPGSVAIPELLRASATSSVVHLTGLGVADVAGLLAVARGGDLEESDLALAHEIRHQSGGNAALAELLIRCATESGSTDRSIAVPPGLESVIRRLLGNLPAELADYLLAAAVVGPDFDLDCLNSAAGLDERVGNQLAEQLVERGWLAPITASRRSRFLHPIVRDAIFGYLASRRSHRVVHRYLEAPPGMTA